MGIERRVAELALQERRDELSEAEDRGDPYLEITYLRNQVEAAEARLRYALGKEGR